MAIEANAIEHLLKKNIPNACVKITDLAGDGNHYAVHVVSQIFLGKSRVAQHKIVYNALEGLMDAELHALQISTTTE